MNLATYSTHYFRPSRKRLTTTLTVLTLILLAYVYNHSTSPQQAPLTLNHVPLPASPTLHIIKATILYEPSNSISPRSLALHEPHGYPTHVLRTPIVRGFTNHLLWLHSLIVQELQRDQGAEWILSFSSTILLNNANIPLHTFLPPNNTFPSLCIIAIKPDHAAMSSALFFIRVHTLSLRIVTLALAAVYEQGPDGEWGADGVAGALGVVFEREAYRDKVVYQPVEWYDGLCAVFVWSKVRGSVEGLIEMESVMDSVRRNDKVCPSEQEVNEFWGALVEAKQVLSEARDRGYTSEEGDSKDEVREVRYWVEVRSWDSEGVRRSVEKLKEKLGIGEVEGFEMVVG